jgi:hypothetical protein
MVKFKMNKIFTLLLAGLCSGCADIVMDLAYTRADVLKIETAEQTGKSEIIHRFRVRGGQRLIISISPNHSWIQSSHGQKPSFSQVELKSLEVSVLAESRPHKIRGFLIDRGENKIIPLNQRISGTTGKFTTSDRYAEQLVVASLPFATEDASPKCDFILTIKDPSGITKSKGINVSGGFQDGF